MSAPASLPSRDSVLLPLRFVVTGFLCLVTSVVLLILRPDLLASYHYNQYVVAVTHLMTLGCIASIIMGATYQLVPVALETELHSERTARWQFWIHCAGFVGMVVMFWRWDLKQVGHFGSWLAVGVGLYAYNVVGTLRQVRGWTVVSAGVASAVFWLLGTVLAGLYLAAAKCWDFSPFGTIPQMHAHAHLGILGFFILMIVAVSYKLVPMFVVGDIQRPRRAWWSLGLINLGLAGLFPCVLLDSRLKPGFGLLCSAGLLLFGLEITAIFKARKRRLLDWGLRGFFTAVFFLAPVAVIGIVLSWPRLPANAFTTQLENVYGFLALFGVVVFAMLGMLYKIVPFLVWYAAYGPEIGRSKVPALAELYSLPLQVASLGAYLVGLLVASAATLLESEPGVRASGVLILLSLLLMAVNLAKILSHLHRPRIEPLGSPRPKVPTAPRLAAT